MAAHPATRRRRAWLAVNIALIVVDSVVVEKHALDAVVEVEAHDASWVSAMTWPYAV
jgi:hypothetical protein